MTDDGRYTKDYDDPERQAVRADTQRMVDEAREREHDAPRPGAITTKLEDLKAAAAEIEVDLEDHDTNPRGRLSNEGLLRAFLTDANDWREKHDREANDRHGAMMSAVMAYQGEARAEISALKVRVGAIEMTGLRKAVGTVVICAAIAVAIAAWVDTGIRAYSVIYAPVIRALPSPR